jgi:hypothetical protein
MKNLFYIAFCILFCQQLQAQSTEWKPLYKGLTLSKSLFKEDKVWFIVDKMGIFYVQKDGSSTQLLMPGLTSLPPVNSYYQIIDDGPNSMLIVTDYINLWQFDGENVTSIQYPTLPSEFKIHTVSYRTGQEGIWASFHNSQTQDFKLYHYHQGIWTLSVPFLGIISQINLPNGLTWKAIDNGLTRIQNGITNQFIMPDTMSRLHIGTTTFVRWLTPILVLPDGSVLVEANYEMVTGGCGSDYSVYFERFIIFTPQTNQWSWLTFNSLQPLNVVISEDGKAYFQNGHYLSQILGTTDSIIILPDVLGDYARLIAADALGQFWFADAVNDLIRFAPDGFVQKFGHIKTTDVPLKHITKTVDAIPNSHRMWLGGDSLSLYDQTYSQQYLNKSIRSVTFNGNNDPVLEIGLADNTSNLYQLVDNQFFNTTIVGGNPTFVVGDTKVWYIKSYKIFNQTIGQNDEHILPNIQENIPDVLIESIKSDNLGQLYALAYNDNGIYKRNIAGQWSVVAMPWFLKGFRNNQIMIDGKNRLNWRCLNAWYRLNGVIWQPVPLSDDAAAVFNENYTFDFAVENDSVSWVATQKGLYRIGQNSVQLLNPLGINTSDYYNEIKSISVDSLGIKWMVSSTYGLLAYQENGLVLSNDEIKTTTNILSDKSVLIMPDPNNGIFSVKCPFEIEKPALWRIYAATGQLLEEKIIKNSAFDVDLGTVKVGLYFYFLQTEKGVFSGKVMIE